LGRERDKKYGHWFKLTRKLLKHDAYKALSSTAKVTYQYFLLDKRMPNQKECVLTFAQARENGICSSPDTFDKAKKQLVSHGFLDPLDGGGFNEPARFKYSDRWEEFGTDSFKKRKYKSGHGSKYFQVLMKDEKKKKKIIDARWDRNRKNLEVKVFWVDTEADVLMGEIPSKTVSY